MIRKEVKDQVIAEYATHEGDTGSPEVQIAVLTYRINELTCWTTWPRRTSTVTVP